MVRDSRVARAEDGGPVRLRFRATSGPDPATSVRLLHDSVALLIVVP